MNSTEIAHNFWSRVETGDKESCWNWLGRKDRDGYGVRKYRGHFTYVHRVAWILTHGTIEKYDTSHTERKMCVLHSCKNRLCCNPAHLFLAIIGEKNVFQEKEETPEETANRFWRKVNKNGENGCWTWTMATNRFGYGIFEYQGKNHMAHRFAWGLVNGELPRLSFPMSRDHICVLHRCDNPPCCNPNHLFLGKMEDNFRNMKEKGRGAHGEKLSLKRRGKLNSSCKLTEQQVIEIRAMYDTRKYGDLIKIARRFGINVSHVCRIGTRKGWKYLGEKRFR